MASISSSIVSFVDNGTPFHLRGNIDAIAGNTVTVISLTVPVSTTKKLSQLWVTAINDGYFSLQADGLEIAAGRLDNVCHNVCFFFNPVLPLDAGVLLELTYTSDDDPTFGSPITAFLSGSDFTT